MSRFKHFSALLLLFWAQSLSAQSFEAVFPGLSGQVLLDSLFDRFRPDTVLPYANARDTLYAKVLAIDDDTLRCIYSGHALYLDPTQDPTQYVYLNGTSNGINTEHAYPQSKGAADGNARSDMHHLFPARIPVNDARGDVPYGDIPDNLTQKWFFKDQVSTTIPAINRDNWSESRTGLFEPRESVKGDIARAVFYFYTMYRNQANTADPNFFELQRGTLCQWQQLDPADSAELVKTWRIAHWQDNKPNPYILDCTLAFRTFCPEVTPDCTVGVHTPNQQKLKLQVVPNPLLSVGKVELDLPFSGDIQGVIKDITGRVIARFSSPDTPAGHFQWPLELTGVNDFYFLEIHLAGANGRQAVGITPLVKI